MRKIVKLNITLEIPFESYGTKKLDNKVETFLKRYVKETLDNHCMFFPLYIEKDKDGAYIEDCTKKTKIKVRRKE